MAKSSALLPNQAGEGPPRSSVLGILGSGMDIRSLMVKPAAQMQSAQLICGEKKKKKKLKPYQVTREHLLCDCAVELNTGFKSLGSSELRESPYLHLLAGFSCS